MGRRWAWLLAALALAPTAAAQGECRPPDLLLAEETLVVDPGDARALSIFVQNTNPVPVVAFLNVTSPSGWGAVLDTQRAALGPRTPSGANATVRPLTVTAPQRGSGEAHGDVLVRVVFECAAGDASPPSEARLAVRLAEPATPWLYVGLGLVLAGSVAAAVWRAQRARGAVRLSSPLDRAVADAAKGATIPLYLENLRSRPETVVLRADGLPDGWTATFAVPEATLEPGEAKDLWVTVRPPPHAEPGDAADVRVRADPRLGARGGGAVHVRVEAGGAPHRRNDKD